MSIDYTINSLLSFLDEASDKAGNPDSPLSKMQIASRKEVLRDALLVLNDEEKQDIKKIKVEAVVDKLKEREWKNQTDRTLAVRTGRLKEAVNDYIRYASIQDSANTSRDILSRNEPRSVSYRREMPYRSAMIRSDIPSPETATTALLVAIRDNLVVRISDLPRDLTEQEAEKICRLVRANIV